MLTLEGVIAGLVAGWILTMIFQQLKSEHSKDSVRRVETEYLLRIDDLNREHAEEQAKSASRYLLEAQAKSELSAQLDAVEERLQVAEHMFNAAEEGSALTTRMNLELGVELAQAERSVSELQRKCESLEATERLPRDKPLDDYPF